MSKGVKFTGLNELQKALNEKTDLSAVQTVVRKNGASMQTKAQRNADFKKGYQTGTTKRSISLTMSDNGMTATVQPGTEYSPYLEWGTRYMEAQPFVKPAFNDQKDRFLSDLKKLVR